MSETTEKKTTEPKERIDRLIEKLLHEEIQNLLAENREKILKRVQNRLKSHE